MAAGQITTIGDLITLALKDAGVIGVGQTALAEDSNDALMRLNAMLGQWQRKRWLVYHLVDYAFQSTGATSCTIGPGGNFNVTVRPDSIASAFARQNVGSNPNQIDYPLEIIPARETYNLIALKNLSSFPQYVYYDAAWPLGTLYFWPVPTSQFELHVTIKDVLSPMLSLATTINLPPEYVEALLYNLAARLRPAYQLEPDASITALAEASLNTIRNANAQIPILRMPRELNTGAGGRYNIYSDQAY